MRTEKTFSTKPRRRSEKKPGSSATSTENAQALNEELNRLIKLANRISKMLHDELTLDQCLKALDVLGKNSTRINSLMKNLDENSVDKDAIETLHESMNHMIEEFKNKSLNKPGKTDGAADNISRRDHLTQ